MRGSLSQLVLTSTVVNPPSMRSRTSLWFPSRPSVNFCSHYQHVSARPDAPCAVKSLLLAWAEQKANICPGGACQPRTGAPRTASKHPMSSGQGLWARAVRTRWKSLKDHLAIPWKVSSGVLQGIIGNTRKGLFGHFRTYQAF